MPQIATECHNTLGEALVSARAGSPKATMKAMMDAVLIALR